MAGTPDFSNNLAALDGFFKNVYSDKISKIIPEDARLQQLVKFLPKDRQPGLQFNQPVTLGLEHGFSYLGTEGNLIELNDHIPGQVKNATVNGYEMVLRSAIPYVMISRSTSTEKAFESATKYVVANMVDSFTKRLEVELMYGQADLAEIDAAVGLSTTAAAVALTAASWAPGIWGGGEKMLVDITNSAMSAVVLSSVIVDSVDYDNKQLYLKLSTGTYTTSAGEKIIPHGAFGNQMKGLHKIMTETSTLFGINTTQYNLWKATQYNMGGVAAFNGIQKAIAKAVARGFKGNAIALVNPEHWDDLVTDEAALRKYDSSYNSKKLENGTESIVFYAQNGKVEIKPSIYCKQGFIYVFNPEVLARVGSLDITFERPGMGGKYFFDLPNYNALELRAMSDQALFCAKPNQLLLITGVTIA